MLRLSTLIFFFTASVLLLSACGSEEPEELNLPTPVPVYTASARVAAVPEGSLAEMPAADDETLETPTPEPMAADENDAAAESAALPASNGTPADTSSTDVASGPEAPPAGDGALDTADAVSMDDLTAVEAVTGTDTTTDVDIVVEPTASEVAVNGSEPLSTIEAVTVTGIVSDAESDDVESDIAEAALVDSESTTAIGAAPAATETEMVSEGDEGMDTEETATVSGDEDDAYAGLPALIAALMADADPARGEQLTLQNGCIGCHNLDPDVPMAGPTWYGLAETASTRVDGQSAASYLYNSIVNTNEFIVEGYAANIMLQTYGETLSDQDLSDLIAYLLTLEGEQ